MASLRSVGSRARRAATSASPRFGAVQRRHRSGQNLIEKIAGQYAVGVDPTEVYSGNFVSVSPAHVMTHDNTAAVMGKFKDMGLSKVADNRQIVFTLDHNVQDKSEGNLAKYQGIEDFAKQYDIDFYPAGRGIGHQVLCEEGYVRPNTMVVASDSHSNMYGGLGCLGTPVVRTDAACLWATGKTWWQVPPVARVELNGEMQPGVVGKDVIIALCGAFGSDQVLNHAIEFAGDGIKHLSIDERLTIANMTTEWGALAGVFPADAVLVDWYAARQKKLQRRGLVGVPSDADATHDQSPRISDKYIAHLSTASPLASDPDASYSRVLAIDLSSVEPHVSGPNSVKIYNTVSALEEEKIAVNKAYLVSCVNSRQADIAAAADIVRGKQVADGVEFYVAAASSEVQADCEESGDWQTLMDAGCIELPPGCGPCIGLGKGILDENEVGISATNRNFKGRMGAQSARAYLASPAVVAASALAGHISRPDTMTGDAASLLSYNDSSEPAAPRERKAAEVLPDFPATISGKIIFVHEDNINTDGIYPGKYTYEELTAAEQAEVVMENYDAKFLELMAPGDVLVGGFNFGTGSSREQAATALKHASISAVIVGSVSETYKRNALNNGLLVIEIPELVRELKHKFGDSAPTFATGWGIALDFAASQATVLHDGEAGREETTFAFNAVGQIAQELIIAGGLEEWAISNAA